jgi:hypothetical protein
MAAKLPMDIHESFYRVVHDYPAGVPALAAKMGIPPGTLYNKADPGNEGNHKPTLADGVVATLLTGDKRVLHSFAALAGEVCITLPDLSQLTTDALMFHLLQIEKEGGDFWRQLHAAMSADDQIDRKEYADIEREAHEWIAAILESLVRMKEMSGGAK